MKVKCIAEGRRHAAKFQMKPGDVLELDDKVAQSLIDSGHVKVFDEPEVTELTEESVIEEGDGKDEAGWIGKPPVEEVDPPTDSQIDTPGQPPIAEVVKDKE